MKQIDIDSGDLLFFFKFLKDLKDNGVTITEVRLFFSCTEKPSFLKIPYIYMLNKFIE